MTEERLLTAKEVAEWLGIDERTVTNMAARGELSGAKIARKWRFARADVQAYIERQKTIARQQLEQGDHT